MGSYLGGLPQPPFTNGKDSYHFSAEWGAWFNQAQNILRAASTFGTTGQRPTTGLYITMPYLDTTLGKPIWIRSLNPTVWVDATGTPV